jgi:protein-S-isoprenylcysteine O-methyltransferase Ste14
MALREEFTEQGEWLFRRRSFGPVILLPVLFFAVPQLGALQTFLLDPAGAPKFANADLYLLAFKIVALIIGALGLVVRAMVAGYVPAGTSGRNTHGQQAESLNTIGLYSIVRHPLYLGNFLSQLGVLLYLQVWWFALIGILGFWLYYERIMMAEEAFLREKFGADYLEWASRTPAFFPRFRQWNPPSAPFSLRTVFRREQSGLFLYVTTFTGLEILLQGLTTNRWMPSLTVIALWAAGMAFYAVLSILKKNTKVLDVDGRC